MYDKLGVIIPETVSGNISAPSDEIYQMADFMPVPDQGFRDLYIRILLSTVAGATDSVSIYMLFSDDSGLSDASMVQIQLEAASLNADGSAEIFLPIPRLEDKTMMSLSMSAVNDVLGSVHTYTVYAEFALSEP